MEWIDKVVYAIVIAVTGLALWLEVFNYDCVTYRCKSWYYCGNKDTYKGAIEEAVEQQLKFISWKKSLLAAVALTFFFYWWFFNRLPTGKELLIVAFVIFGVIQIIWSFHQSHFVEPMNKRVLEYLRGLNDTRPNPYYNPIEIEH